MTTWKEPWEDDLKAGAMSKWFPLLQTAVYIFLRFNENYSKNPAAYAVPYDWGHMSGTPVNEDYRVDHNRDWDDEAKLDLVLDVHQALTCGPGAGPISMRYQTILARADVETDLVESDGRLGQHLNNLLQLAILAMLEKRREGSFHARLFSQLKEILTSRPFAEFGVLPSTGTLENDIRQEVGKTAYGLSGKSTLRGLNRHLDLPVAINRFRLVKREESSVEPGTRQRNPRVFSPGELRTGVEDIVTLLAAAVSPGFVKLCAEHLHPDLLPIAYKLENLVEEDTGRSDSDEISDIERMFDPNSEPDVDGRSSSAAPSLLVPGVDSPVVDVSLEAQEEAVVAIAVENLNDALSMSEKVCLANKIFSSHNNDRIALAAGLAKTQYVSRERQSAEAKIRNLAGRAVMSYTSGMSPDDLAVFDEQPILREIMRRCYLLLQPHVIEGGPL